MGIRSRFGWFNAEYAYSKKATEQVDFYYFGELQAGKQTKHNQQTPHQKTKN